MACFSCSSRPLSARASSSGLAGRGRERLRGVRELCGGEGQRLRLLAEEVKNTLGVELMAGQQA